MSAQQKDKLCSSQESGTPGTPAAPAGQAVTDPGAAVSPGPVVPKAGAKSWLGLSALMLAVLLVSIDNTVLSFALPEISQALAPTGKQLLWIVDVYPLVLAGLLVTMGTLGDRIGRRRLLLIGATGFGIVSIYAAFSPSPEHLIAARALQGFFGATLMPSTLALLRNLFPDAAQRRLAVAIWAVGFSAGAALGPVVGGWLLERYFWGSVFLINVPVLIVMLAVSPFLLPESRDPRPGRLDPASVVLAIAAMASFVYGIKSVATGAMLLGVSMIVAGAIAGVVFVRRQVRSVSPLLDIKLFRIPIFSASIAANLMAIMALAGMLFFLSQYLQLVLGYSPIEAAIHLLPGLLATVVTGLLAVPLSRRFPVRHLIPIGLALAAVGFAVGTQLGVTTSVWLLTTAFMLVGAGVGLAETLTNDAILSAVPPHKAGAASGISETAYELGALMGTAVLGSILTAVYRSDLVVPSGVSDSAAAAARETLGGALDVAAALPAGVGSDLAFAARESFTHGADVTALVGAIIVSVAALMVLVALRPRRGA